MKTISIIGNKGGQGRTNVCANLAASLVLKGKKVLCIDLDAQSNLSSCLGINVPEELPLTIVDFIERYIKQEEIGDIREAIQHLHGIDLIASTVRLNDFEFQLQSIMDGVYAISTILDGLNEYDYILIDCNSNTEGIYNIAALAASDECILPTQAQFLSSNNIQITLSIIQKVKRKINRSLKIGGIVLTMAQQHTNSTKNAIERVHTDYSDYANIFDTIIPFSVAVSDSNEHGIPTVLYNPSNKVSIAYKSFAEEVINYGNR